jgi:hypothetical protein
MSCFWVLLVGVVSASQGNARAAELNVLLPHEVLAFVELDPGMGGLAGGGKGEGNALLDVGLEAMQSFGVLPKEAAMAGDVLRLGEMGGKYRNCMALLDADLKVEKEKELKCKSVQVAWIIENGGGAEEARGIVERLTKLLDHVSTPATARQEIRKVGEREFVSFRDTRWPEWIALGWIQDGRQFVLTFGAGAMERYLAMRPAGDIPWKGTVASVDEQAGKLGSAGHVMARLYVSAKTFREKFPEAMQKTVLGRMFEGVGFGGATDPVEVGVLTARGKGRVISLDQGSLVGGKVVVTPWTANVAGDSALLKLVPASATAYMTLRVDWVSAYERMLLIFDSVVTDPTDDPLAKKVDMFAERVGVNVRKDILAHLQPIVVVHDVPQHPLKLPLMVTAVGAAEAGSREKVEKALATLVAAAGERLDKKGAAKKVNELARFRLRRDKDGVSYMQFGLVGPGWAWVENRLVMSWSPAAVRANMAAAKEVPASAFTERGSR